LLIVGAPEADTRWRPEEEDTIHEGKICGMVDPQLEAFDERRDESAARCCSVRDAADLIS
jgi:hypothetical protein